MQLDYIFYMISFWLFYGEKLRNKISLIGSFTVDFFFGEFGSGSEIVGCTYIRVNHFLKFSFKFEGSSGNFEL